MVLTGLLFREIVEALASRSLVPDTSGTAIENKNITTDGTDSTDADSRRSTVNGQTISVKSV